MLTPGPGSGIRNRFIPDPGSRIPDPKHIFKKFYNSLKIGPNFLLQLFKNKKLFYFVKIMATKKGMPSIFFTPFLLLFLDPGSEIRDPGSGIWDPGSRMGKIQDPGSGINIRIRNTAFPCLHIIIII
jgi:hypothetical protein